MSCGSAPGLITSPDIFQCTMWQLSWVHNYVVLCQNSMHSLTATPTVQYLESARSRRSRHHIRVTCIRQACHSWAKTLHSVKILYRHAVFVCNLYVKNEIAGSKANEVRYWLFCQKGRGTRDYFQRQTASVSMQTELTFNPASGGRLWMSGRTCQNLMALYNWL